MLLRNRHCLVEQGLKALNEAHWAEAKRVFLLALEFTVSDMQSTALCHLGLANAYFHLGKHHQAEQEAILARELNPQLPEIYWLLAQISYAEENFLKTLSLLDYAFSFSGERDTSAIAQFQGKVLRELEVEESYTQRESTHFAIKYNLSFEEDVIEELLLALEKSFAYVQENLSLSPERLITVVVYDPGEYQKATHGPQWSAALYDGKIRLPLSSQLTPLSHASEWVALQQTILHECVHAFLQQVYGQTIPTWANEGLAQFATQERSQPDWQVLQQLAQENLLLSVSSLESSFLQLNREEAKRAYLEAFAIVNLLSQEAGWFGIRALLRSYARGADTPKALQEVYNLTPEELEKKMVAHIRSKNGRSN